MCSFLFCLDPININKEITSLLSSAHIFLEKKGIKAALMKHLKTWFYNPVAFAKTETVKQREEKLETVIIEPGFIDKLTELFKMRKTMRELKAELEEKNGLSTGYVHQEGSFIVGHLLYFQSSYLNKIFKTRRIEVNESVQRICNKARFQNLIAAYNGLRCQLEVEYDTFMNTTLWNVILSNFCERTHSQFGIVALTRAGMIIVNKEIWKAFLEVRANIQRNIDKKRKRAELEQETLLKEKQAPAATQIKNLVNAEFIQNWEKLPKEVQLALTAQVASTKKSCT